MASKIKQKITKNLYNVIYNKFYKGRYDEFIGCFNLNKNQDNKVLWQCQLAETISNFGCIKKCQEELLDNKTIENIACVETNNKTSIQFEIEQRQFIKDVLDSNPVALNYEQPKKKVIVEFSSPNIAKPFHVGHLRSTMIGNCISHVKEKLGDDVLRVNYLGDWGTQFGTLQVGLDINKYAEEDFKKNPIQILFKAYVTGNRNCELNPETFEKAKKYFADLESGNTEIINKWNRYKNWTMEELKLVYGRLGVSFDEYCWESDYKRKQADSILSVLEEKGILSVDDKGRKVAKVEDKMVPLIKSDDTTLYLLRDLMAVVDRQSKYNFDEMYYVVENGQNLHFSTLFTLCKQLKFDKTFGLEHVKFGRIHGMSTRKGKVTFLKEILDEAQERSYEKQVNSKNTKVSLDVKDIADILGVSAVVVNDLKQRRKKDYEFSWEKILQLNGETGVKLQYCHCRLCNLELNSGATPATECDPEALLEPEAVALVVQIARYEEVLWHCNNELEPCILVNYLFQLAQAVNKAFKVLGVKHSEEHLASQRILLFNKSREVLADGLKLLGLKLLTKM